MKVFKHKETLESQYESLATSHPWALRQCRSLTDTRRTQNWPLTHCYVFRATWRIVW